jgi:hypothetical protein
MEEDMQQQAVDVATAALGQYDVEKDIAAYIKKVHPLPRLFCAPSCRCGTLFSLGI